MKRLLLVLAAALIGAPLGAQPAATASSPTAAAAYSTLRSADELEQLLAPIALYPDALIALILPAATAPTDIVLAARHWRETPGDRSQIEHRAWDESVKSLTHYPEVLLWLDDNLQWTRQVGEAFALQPADVMQAMQRLRVRARAAGTLIDTPQQQVIAEAEIIRIVPAQPDVIYVPHYAPEIVFYDRPSFYARPFLTFGLGVAAGSWLAFDCDWRRNTVWVGNRHRQWVSHDWRRPVIPIAPLHPPLHYRPAPDVRPWRPPTGHRPAVNAGHRFRPDVIRPAPFGIAPMNTRPSAPAATDRGRRPSPSPPAAVSPLAPSFTAPPRNDRQLPRPATQVTVPARITPPPVTMPNLQPLPTARRPERTAERPAAPAQDGQRSRHVHAPRDVMGRPAASAPAAAPSLRMAPPGFTPPQRGPAATRAYSRGQPPPAPPAAVTPTSPPARAPAAAPPQGGESRGHRGGGNRSEGWNRSR